MCCKACGRQAKEVRCLSRMLKVQGARRKARQCHIQPPAFQSRWPSTSYHHSSSLSWFTSTGRHKAPHKVISSPRMASMTPRHRHLGHDRIGVQIFPGTRQGTGLYQAIEVVEITLVVMGPHANTFCIGSAGNCAAGRRRCAGPTSRGLRPDPWAISRTGNARSVCNAEPGSDNSLSVDAAEDSVREIISHAKSRNLDAILSFVPDQVIELATQRKSSRGGKLQGHPQDLWRTLTFEDVARAGTDVGFVADAWAFRHLIYGPPQDVQLLSGLKIEEGHYLMRCSSLSSSGEEAVLTLGLRQEECLTPHYKGFEMAKRWALDRISGEQGGLYMGIMPTLPRPNWAPDTVVCAQLDALRRDDMETVFGFASPKNRLATGPLERFEQMLRHPVYAGLMDEEQHAEVLAVAQGDRAHTTVIVGLTGGIPAGAAPKALYLWSLNLQETGTPYQDCWMTDSVQRIGF